jgi:hypothetical protein
MIAKGIINIFILFVNIFLTKDILIIIILVMEIMRKHGGKRKGKQVNRTTCSPEYYGARNGQPTLGFTPGSSEFESPALHYSININALLEIGNE